MCYLINNPAYILYNILSKYSGYMNVSPGIPDSLIFAWYSLFGFFRT